MKIAIAGYGVEGEANYQYWNTPDNEVTIVDESLVPTKPVPEGAKTLLGDGVFSQLQEFDLVVRTAGLSPQKLVTDGKVWSSTNEFFARCAEKNSMIIGVTGTKGKGTTSSFITSILQAAGKTVHLVGNIGTPALEVLPNIQPGDIVVYELSSFQLWDLEVSPHIAVVLMIEPDHLDVHANFDDYLRAKMHITIEQNESDIVVYHRNNEWSSAIAKISPAEKAIAYPFAIDDFKDSIKLPGVHNQENASAAIAVVRELGVDDVAIRQGLAVFTGLPHRLQFVDEVRGVKYYDDSIATTPGSAIAAINAFDQRITLLLGGRSKGGDLSELLRLCHDKQVSVIAIGENRHNIAELCAAHGVEYDVEPSGMESIVRRAAMEAEPGSVVILSPAASSFDMFKSYADRGNQFIAAVGRLAAS